MSGILKALNAAKKDLTTAKHPLYEAELSEKLHYCTGVAMLAGVDDTIDEQEQQFLSELIFCLDLPEDFTAKVIEGIGAVDDTMVKAIVAMICNNGWKDYFMFDLYRMAQCDQEISEHENEVTAYFGAMLGLSEAEQEFYRDFSATACIKDLEQAQNCYKICLDKGYRISLPGCKFIFPGFIFVEEIIGYKMKKGEVRVIEQDCIIKNKPFVVGPGTKLQIKGVHVSLISSGIEVNGGAIEIVDSIISVGKKCSVILNVTDTAEFIVNKTTFNCNHSSGVLFTGGEKVSFNECNFNEAKDTIICDFKKEYEFELELIKCNFEGCINEDYSGAIYSSGNDNANIKLNGCNFSDCQGGTVDIIHGDIIFTNCIFTKCISSENAGAIESSGGEMVIDSSSFWECESGKYGGALFLCGTRRIYLKNCNFEKCQSGSNGGAIYSGGIRKNGILTMDNCTFSKCKSGYEKGAIVSAPSDRFEHQNCKFIDCTCYKNVEAYELPLPVKCLENLFDVRLESQ